MKVYVSKDNVNNISTILNSETPQESGILKLNPLRVSLPKPNTRVSSANKSKPVHFKWQKAELIGTGATGSVYLAFSLPTGKMMAVKQMDVTDLDDHQKISLEREITMLTRFDHPHIIKYYGLEAEPPFINLFLEYAPGGSIKTYIHKFKEIDSEIIKSYFLK